MALLWDGDNPLTSGLASLTILSAIYKSSNIELFHLKINISNMCCVTFHAVPRTLYIWYPITPNTRLINSAITGCSCQAWCSHTWRGESGDKTQYLCLWVWIWKKRVEKRERESTVWRVQMKRCPTEWRIIRTYKTHDSLMYDKTRISAIVFDYIYL